METIQRHGGFSGYLACDAAFIYSDLSYYMEIRKLWTEWASAFRRWFLCIITVRTSILICFMWQFLYCFQYSWTGYWYCFTCTSSVYEVWTHKNSLTAKELISSGYQVGKEIIGTTVNTLLFAYLGGSILLFAYVQTQQYNLEIILNSKFLFQDVAIMLSGAIACLFTVPVSIRCVIRQIHHAATETDHSWSDLFSQSLQIPWSISPLHCRRNPWIPEQMLF